MLRTITDISQINPQQWDELARTVRTASWFQTCEAADFFAQIPEELRTVVCAVEEDGILQGVMVAYVTWNGGSIGRHFTRRAIVNGGPMIREDISEAALELLLSSLKEQLHRQAIFVEIRNFADYSRWKAVFERCGFVYEQHLNFIADISEEAAILSNMSESRRRQIRKALDAGAHIEEAHSEEEVKSFYRILHQLYVKKVHTPLFSEEFFLRFYRGGYGRYLLVKHEDQVIGGIMCPMQAGQTIYEWYVCGADEENKDLYPSVVATYAAMKYGSSSGCRIFDFMGAGKPNEEYGVRNFKARFGGKLVDYGRFQLICSPVRYKFGALGVKLLRIL